MLHHRASALASLLSVLSACGPEGSPDHPLPQEGVPTDRGTGEGTDGTGGSDAAVVGATGGAALQGLPCDVADLLASHCLSCHGASLAGGATVRLNSAEALRTMGAGSTLAQLSITRMRASSSPMPPVGARVPSVEVAAFETWVQAGMPDGSCETAAQNDPFAAAATCSSNAYWTGGNKESPMMHPGQACIDCHTRGVRGERGPGFALAGTVFVSGHEPDDCNGVNGRTQDAVVEITDASGKVTRLSVNSAGNFYLEAQPIRTPYTATLRYQGRTRSMVTPQTSGDCNSCHTQAGTNGAPGRIALP